MCLERFFLGMDDRLTGKPVGDRLVLFMLYIDVVNNKQGMARQQITEVEHE